MSHWAEKVRLGEVRRLGAEKDQYGLSQGRGQDKCGQDSRRGKTRLVAQVWRGAASHNGLELRSALV